MVKVYLNKVPFSADRNFVLYDWKDSKGEHYMRDMQGMIYFFIKDVNRFKNGEGSLGKGDSVLYQPSLEDILDVLKKGFEESKPK